jgi:hypothetical protein
LLLLESADILTENAVSVINNASTANRVLYKSFLIALTNQMFDLAWKSGVQILLFLAAV